MYPTRIGRIFLVTCVAAFALTGCEKSGEPAATPSPSSGTTPTPAANTTPAAEPAPAALPPNHPPMPAASTTSVAEPAGGTLELTGLTMTVPEGWITAPVAAGMFAASEAKSFTVPGTGEGCTVKVTYFPMMKGKDDININRWLGQVTQADGSPTTRDQATVTVTELGHVRLTIVDATGSVSQGMGAASQTGQRLIAAIVDHPQGPHFIKASGDVESMKQAEAQIDAFLKSAKTR